MGAPPHSAKVLRFGLFELDPETQQLRKAGAGLRLQAQPFKVLILLTSRPGKIVTREELRQELWGNETFVDFEQGLNYCIRQIRSVLGDEVQTPRYIETIPRRGYRFIAAVEGLESPAPASTADAAAKKDVRRWRVAWMAGAAVVLVLVAITTRYVTKVRAGRLTEKDTVVLADFTNRTGDPVFDDTLKQALNVALNQSPFLNVLSDSKVAATLKLMSHPTNTPLTPELAFDLCQRAGSKAYIAGSIDRLGSEYVLGMKAVNCQSGDVLGHEQVTAASKEKVLDSLGLAAARLRGELGESLVTVQRFNVPLAEATTSSLEALKKYSMGVTIGHEKGNAPSIPFYRQAIELDPDFALAHATLAIAYKNSQQPSLALESATKAYKLRDRVSERERLRITATYFDATGELERRVQALELWIANYPRDHVPHVDLGAVYVYLGEYEKALAEYEEALRLKPDSVLSYANLGGAYLYLNRLDEAKAILNQPLTHNLDSGFLRQNFYYLAFLQGNDALMAQQLAWASGRPGDEDSLLSMQSDTESYYGRLNKARDFSRRAVESALRSDSRESAALWQVNAALHEAELGNRGAAKLQATAALKLFQGRDVELAAALALARAGEVSEAKSLADKVEKDFPSNTLVKFYWLPAVRAAIAIEKGDSSQALTELQAAVPYERGNAGMFINYLYPPYLRGQAYLLARNGPAAAREFQKLLDDKGIVMNFVIGSLSRLQVSRAYMIAGDTNKAKATYQDFFALWKGADPDIPIYKQAKSEYAKLQ